MLIEVTAADIACGTAKSCRLCPVALASERAFGRPVSVGNYFLCIDGTGQTFSLAAAAIDFIAAFDQGKPMQPFSFEVGEVA